MRLPACFRFALLLAALALACGEYAHAEVAVIVSAKSPIAVLSKTQISDLYLGLTKQFPNGQPAVPIDLPESSPARDEFYAKFAGKSAVQLKYHWAKTIFTGRGLPPKVVADSAEMKKAVAENPQAIGYIEPSMVDSSVRVLGSQ